MKNASGEALEEPADRVVAVCSPVIDGRQPLVALTASGKLFRRDPDPKDFNQGPNHKQGFIWTEIKGPLGE